MGPHSDVQHFQRPGASGKRLCLKFGQAKPPVARFNWPTLIAAGLNRGKSMSTELPVIDLGGGGLADPVEVARIGREIGRASREIGIHRLHGSDAGGEAF